MIRPFPVDPAATFEKTYRVDVLHPDCSVEDRRDGQWLSACADETASALDEVKAVAPSMGSGTIRNQLARLLLRGNIVDRPIAALSGGERFRVCLAKLLLADPPAQMLILDEPTNNLDIASVEQLVQALDSYRGALLVLNHDHAFLDRLGIDTTIELDADGHLHQHRETNA